MNEDPCTGERVMPYQTSGGTDDQRGPLPLVVGVTGHRDLREEDREALENQVAKVFDDLKDRYSHTPLLLLSALAEGADRLVARVALGRGAHLVAPLPMRRAEYEKDFGDPASRTEFATLLDRAQEWFELSAVPGSTPDDFQVSGEQRNLQWVQIFFNDDGSIG